jgi:glycosyltransferase involved in cell wall biosynthesis
MKTIAVVTAYNVEKTLERTVREIPRDVIDKIIVIDDCSRDRTAEIARSFDVELITHEQNRGYGGGQKTGYKAALREGADIIVLIHGDYQCDPRLVSYLVAPVQLGVCDIVLGNRVRSIREAKMSGMPMWKYYANRLLTQLENLVLGLNLAEAHTGYRAYSRKVLETLPFEKDSDRYAFDQEIIVQAAYFGFRIGDVPVTNRYMSEASSIGLRTSLTYAAKTLGALLRFVLHKMRIWRYDLLISSVQG